VYTEHLKGTYGETVSVTPNPQGASYSGELGKLLTGYVYTTADNTVTSAVLDVSTEGNITTLKLYFKRAGYGYSIAYYVGDEITPFRTEDKGEALFGTTVSATQQEITDNQPEGYTYDRKEDAVITVDSSKNIVKVYYEPRHDISYQIEYYRETENGTPEKVYEDVFNDGNLFFLVDFWVV
jgi:hypothetical protein